MIYSEFESKNLKSSSEEIQKISEVIVEESEVFGFDPLFILAVIEVESNFEIEAVSKSGARGLMQIIPSTFKEVSDSKRMFDPAENVRAGIRYLGKLSKTFSKPEKLLLAYNAGPGEAGAIIRGESSHSSESAVYADKVMSKYSLLLEKNGKLKKNAKKLYLAKK